MIYLPKRAVFIHIPRTAGNSITSAIASECAGKYIDVIVGTGNWDVENFYSISRHIRARELQPLITEWDEIFKFAIHRPLNDRINSVLKLIKRDRENIESWGLCSDAWKKLVLSDDYEKRIKETWIHHDTEWFTKDRNNNDIGVEIYNYNELPDKWEEICDKCKIPRCKLPHINSSL